MRSTNNNILSEVLSKRSSFIDVLITALFLALGINLISGSLPQLLGWSNCIFLVIGLICCIGSIRYFVTRLYKERRSSRILSGFVCYNARDENIINIENYYLSSFINTRLETTLKLLPNYKQSWISESLENAYRDDERSSIKILREILEYFVLFQLSIHLKDHFQDSKTKYIEVFHEGKFEEIIRHNRVIQLFSDPRTTIEKTKNQDTGGTPNVTHVNQGIDSFTLVLPRESKIRRRDEDGVNNIRKVSIDTGKFIMIIECLFIGINEPQVGFHRYYLGLDRNDRVTDFKIGVKIDVLFKPSIFLSEAGLEYYQWLDSFLVRLEELISDSHFFDKIQWDATYSLIRYIDTIKPIPERIPGVEPVKTLRPEPASATDQPPSSAVDSQQAPSEA